MKKKYIVVFTIPLLTSLNTQLMEKSAQKDVRPVSQQQNFLTPPLINSPSKAHLYVREDSNSSSHDSGADATVNSPRQLKVLPSPLSEGRNVTPHGVVPHLIFPPGQLLILKELPQASGSSVNSNNQRNNSYNSATPRSSNRERSQKENAERAAQQENIKTIERKLHNLNILHLECIAAVATAMKDKTLPKKTPAETKKAIITWFNVGHARYFDGANLSDQIVAQQAEEFYNDPAVQNILQLENQSCTCSECCIS